ncbi:claudin-4-like [Betta splendens]|uniref:Claudin n=1 Tax=Betta splendens TaxID=158456 RepID=A0A6P7PBC4_BETSP|nr:claudin-4-like [Betta splendens]
MPSLLVLSRLHILGAVLGSIGWMGTIISCGYPMWTVSVFLGCGIICYSPIWDGLWMRCEVESTGQKHCKVYSSMLELPQHLQVARAMVVVSVVTGAVAVLMVAIGGKCPCLEDKVVKAKVSIASGVTFIASALLIIIPVSWTAHSVIRDFYDPLVVNSLKREFGASLYIGWASGALLLLGGSLLCLRCLPNHERPYKFITFTSSASDV